VLSLLGTASAWAKSGSGLDEQPVIRRQLLFRGKRHELTADLGATLADAFARNWLLGVSYQYYFNNWLGAGLSLSANLCGVMGEACKTSLAKDVETTHPTVDSIEGLSVFGLIATPHVSLIPISGKFGVFKKVLHYDLHLQVGAAITTAKSLDGGGDLDDTPIGPMIGVGHRVFIGDSMAVTVSLKDYILSRALNATEDGRPAEEEYENNFVLSVSISFYLPSEVQVSH